ncbi:(2Fe-2S)-binding protein, partial [bacterium]|nr:(2Fe-2S)-binding protein [bacterium]
MVNLTIDGQQISIEEGKTLLEAAEELGIRIPTLCYHKALSPYGACRVCVVEIIQRGASKIVASCLYPVQDGLDVQTDTERVLKTRRLMVELLLARCPEAPDIKELAASLEVAGTRIEPKNKDCSLCGLCVRMCHERMGVGAISFSGRGPRREVVPPFEQSSSICQVCGACQSVCPAGGIKLEKITSRQIRPILKEFNRGLNSRPAIHIPFPQAVPNVASIDRRYCVHLNKDKCETCKEFC